MVILIYKTKAASLGDCEEIEKFNLDEGIWRNHVVIEIVGLNQKEH